MTDPYDQARAVVDAAPTAQFVLPAYTGSTTDLGYLKQWVLSQVTAIYGVSASVFDEPTVYSTSILRDFVHRALMQTTAPWSSASDFPTFEGWNDVGLEFRAPAHGLCAEMAWQEWEVFRAFGYQTQLVETLNSTPDAFTDSHATTEVYVADLHQYIVQDSTFNFTYQDARGNYLSWNEARDANLAGTLVFNGFHDYQPFSETGSYSTEIPTSLQIYFEGNYLQDLWEWYSSNGSLTYNAGSLFKNFQTAHSASSFQGNEFASLSGAQSALQGLLGQGEGWQTAASTLRGEGYYVSGFELTDASGAPTSQWLTLRLGDGSYVSLSLTGSVLNGSLDQIENEATGGLGATDMNPGADLSGFLNPLYVLAIDGTLMNTGVNADVVLPHDDFLNTNQSDFLIENTGGTVQLGQIGSGGQVAYSSFGASLGSGGWQLVGSGNYLGEAHDQFLMVSASGALYFGQEGTGGQVTYHSFASLAAGWQVIGSGDFLGVGEDQFLVQNLSSGAVDIGRVSAATNGQAALSAFASLGAWKIVGTGDYLGLGRDEFLMQNASGALYTGTASGQVTYHSFAQLPSGSSVVGSGDFLGLGHDEFLIANASGAVEIGQLGSGQQATLSQFASLGAGWTFEGVGDYLGEGHDQFLIENASGIVEIGDYTGGAVHLTQVSTLASQWTIHG